MSDRFSLKKVVRVLLKCRKKRSVIFMPLTREQMVEHILKNIETQDCDTETKDAEKLEFLFDNCEITIPDENRYFVSVNCFEISQQILHNNRVSKFSGLIPENGLSDGFDSLAYTGFHDFSHTSADWKSVIGLGIYGLRNRVKEYARKAEANGGSSEKQRYYSNVIRAYDAALRFIKRSASQAYAAGRTEMAYSLSNLCERAPESLYEALQTTIVYYTLQHIFEGTNLRTLGRLDSLLYPFYAKETDHVKTMGMLLDYVKEIDRLKAPANIPFALGGTDASGKSLVNKLSYDLLDAYANAGTVNTKLHLLCSQNMPEELVKRALDCVRNGHNSIMFMSDGKIIESLIKLGAEPEDAADYHVVGCYECGASGEITCSCNARVNIPKALEYALNGGKDMLSSKTVGLYNTGKFETFEKLLAEFERQLVFLCGRAMKATDLWEEHYSKMHSAPFLSSTYLSAIEKGGDLYCGYAAKYNNSSLNAIGLANAVDSLAAVKKAVYDDKIITLEQLVQTLKANWAGNEPLRLLIKNRYPKFGQDNIFTDSIARKIVKKLSGAVSGKPNVKGGVYRLGLFSIDWRWEMGSKTAASADGRLSGEPLSQNTSASFGADKNGATAHLKSIAAIDSSDTPNGVVADIDFHSSAVTGENGLNAMSAALKTYFELGGFSVHFNVLNTEILKDAKKYPEKYPTLQVRLCGWNVLFSSLSDKEKDEFIVRSMK